MILFFIVLVSLISASLFDLLPIWENSKSVFILQKESFKVINNPEFSDDQKQKILLSFSGKILFATIKITIYIIITSLPFVCLVVVGHWVFDKTNIIGILLSIKGICLSSVTFLSYYFFKKINERFRV